MVLSFRAASLDYEHVLEGGAAALYPTVLHLQSEFGETTFTPKDLSQATGSSRATAHRQIDRLHRAGVLRKRAFGLYELDASAYGRHLRHLRQFDRAATTNE
jgi:DNA-binding IclR family transcriptional regulator